MYMSTTNRRIVAVYPVALFSAWVLAWIVNLAVRARTGWGSDADTMYWMVMKAIVWVAPALVWIRVVERRPVARFLDLSNAGRGLVLGTRGGNDTRRGQLCRQGVAVRRRVPSSAARPDLRQRRRCRAARRGDRTSRLLHEGARVERPEVLDGKHPHDAALRGDAPAGLVLPGAHDRDCRATPSARRRLRCSACCSGGRKSAPDRSTDRSGSTPSTTSIPFCSPDPHPSPVTLSM